MSNDYALAYGTHASPLDGRCAMEWVSYLAGEARALRSLSLVAQYAGDAGNGVEWARQACRIDPAAAVAVAPPSVIFVRLRAKV